MTPKKYTSKIEFNKQYNSLDIEVKYERAYSKEEEEQIRDYFHWRAKQRGDIVARGDIQVHPQSGDITEEIISFRACIGREIYLGLKRVQKNAPYVFPLLIKDLNKYQESNPDKTELVKHTIRGLEKIIKKDLQKQKNL